MFFDFLGEFFVGLVDKWCLVIDIKDIVKKMWVKVGYKVISLDFEMWVGEKVGNNYWERWESMVFVGDCGKSWVMMIEWW